MRRMAAMGLAALLALFCLPCVSGCKQQDGGEVCLAFLSYIQSGDYAAAYALLDPALTHDGEEDKQSAGRINAKQFAAKYANAFSELGVTSVEYDGIQVRTGDIFTIVNYEVVYRSDKVGDLYDAHKLVAVRSNAKWYVEWSPALIFSDMQWGDSIRVGRVRAKRGEILAGGDMLAQTVGLVSVYAVRSKIEDLPTFVAQAAALLGMTEAAVHRKFNAVESDQVILAQMYPDELKESVKEQLLSIPGVGIDQGNYASGREYPYGSMLAHILGYTGAVSASSSEALTAELARLNEGRTEADGLYNVDSKVGKLGLEAQYERELRGKDGSFLYICTADGVNRRTLYTDPAEDGKDLNLSINVALQQRVDLALSCYLDQTCAGAVVVMNPLTGAVDAMSSYPGYDLNSFARGISAYEYNKLNSMTTTPLYNRLTQGRYPPGSVLKAFTAAAALDTGTLDENYAFTGLIEDDYWLPTEYGAWPGSRIKRASLRYFRLSPLNLRSAVVHSDNIYFANAALMLGWDNYQSYMTRAGLNEAMPFDLNVASAQIHNPDTELSLMLLAESGYGQGEILLTPLQMAGMFCAFANGGTTMRPYLVEGIYSEDGIKYKCDEKTKPRVWKSNIVSQQALDILLPYLEDVVDPSLNGTGQNLRVTSCQIAAKTGTAEIGDDKSRQISWFAGFRTGVEPEDARLVLVMLEVSTDEAYASLKFDIARELLKMSAP